jgi:hypothetical protein
MAGIASEDFGDWADNDGFDLRPLLNLSPEGRAAAERMTAAMRTPLARRAIPGCITMSPGRINAGSPTKTR